MHFSLFSQCFESYIGGSWSRTWGNTLRRNDEHFYWDNSSENCHGLLVDYIWELGRGILSRNIPGFQNWISFRKWCPTEGENDTEKQNDLERKRDDGFHFEILEFSVENSAPPHYLKGNCQVGSWIYESETQGISLWYSLRSQHIDGNGYQVYGWDCKEIFRVVIIIIKNKNTHWKVPIFQSQAE